MKKHFFIFLLLISISGFVCSVRAQKRGNYLFPIQPHTSFNSLSGGMAELRSNHFHMGIDIRTNNQIGLPVYAATDGYISRIKVRAFGYGNAIYIKHPDGTTTLYGHLLKFSKHIADYVRKIQYQREHFEVDLYLSPTQFPVKKGEIIALSGNSGSSGGPHLHFEIRDAHEYALNPLDYGFDEIKDNLSPIVRHVALVPLSPLSLVEDGHQRKEISAYRSAPNNYKLRNNQLTAYGLIGLELDAVDEANGVYFKYGIDEIEVYVNEESRFKMHFDKISFNDQRHMNNYINYEQYVTRRKRYRKCYVPDGAEGLNFYISSKNKGKLFVEDGKIYKIRIRLNDAYGNESNTYFDIVGKKPTTHALHTIRAHRYELQENFLVFNTTISAQDSTSEVCINYLSYPLKPALTQANMGTFVWDLRMGVPDSVLLPNGMRLLPDIVCQIPSQSTFFYSHRDFDIVVPKGSLYDTLYLTTSRKGEDFLIGSPVTPLHKYVTIRLKPTEKISNKAKTHVYAVSGKHLSFEGGKWRGDVIEFKTRNLGQFRLITDEDKPNVRLLRKTSQEIKCKIWDTRSGIASFRATINGRWLLMNYDAKNAILTSELADDMSNLKGDFKLVVTDNAGNETTFELKI